MTTLTRTVRRVECPSWVILVRRWQPKEPTQVYKVFFGVGGFVERVGFPLLDEPLDGCGVGHRAGPLVQDEGTVGSIVQRFVRMMQFYLLKTRAYSLRGCSVE
jgi:hypothetical protein